MIDPARNKLECFLCLFSYLSVNIKNWKDINVYMKNSSEKSCLVFFNLVTWDCNYLSQLYVHN